MQVRDLRLLIYFTQIAHAGSVRGAAERLGVSPPVVSQALRDLEEVVGATLVRRTTRQFALTEAGRDLQEEADAMSHHAAAALDVGNDTSPVTGQLHLSVPAELSVSWLPRLLASYRLAHPGVHVAVQSEDAHAKLGQNKIDLAIRASYRPSANAAQRMRPEPLAILPLECVSAFPEEDRNESLTSRLERIGLLGIHPETQTVLRALDPSGAPIEVSLPPIATASDRLTLYGMARQGLGAALLIGETVAADLAAGRLHRVARDFDFGVVGVQFLTADPMPSRAVRAFIKTVGELESLQQKPGRVQPH
ncbi:MAG: LysR family transcriptional regulator [Pseudomonadota bacterium]